MTTLSELLYPVSPTEFFAEHYSRRALYIPGEEKKLRSVFGYEELNRILNSGPVPLPTLKLAKAGKPVVVEDAIEILQEVQQGATLIIDGVDAYSPGLRIGMAQWSEAMGEPLQVNMYLSQPDNQGFQTHYDTHDVLILQIEGFKHWRIFVPTVEQPLWIQKGHKRDIPEIPYMDICLSPGDVLYVPRGHWHDATAYSEASMHLTVGIMSRTGIDYFNWLTDELRSSEIWRRDFLPPCARTIADAKNSSEFVSKVSQLKKHLADVFDNVETLAAYDSYCRASAQKSFAFDFPGQARPEPEFEEQKFYRTAGQQVWIDEDKEDGVISIAVEDRLYTLMGTAGPLVKQIFSKQQFSADALLESSAPISPSLIADLLRRFVLDGVIHIAEDNRDVEEASQRTT